MKKAAIIFLLSIVLFGGAVYAVDFGGLIFNETELTSEQNPGFGQLNVITAWFNTGTENPLVFSVGGNFSFSYTTDNFTDPGLPGRPGGGTFLGVDLYDLRLKGTFERAGDALPRVFGFEMGRYRTSETTGLVFNHILDGFGFDFVYPFATVTVDVGFTGLIARPASSVLISRLDLVEFNSGSPDSFIPQPEDVLFGPKRIVGILEVEIPSLFQRHTLDFSLMVQEDLRALFENDGTPVQFQLLEEGVTTEQPGRGGLVDTQYFMLGLKGPIVKGFFYNAFGVLNTGRTLSYIGGTYRYVPVLGFTAGGGLRYYNEDLLYSKMGLQFVYSSGDADSTAYYEGNSAGKATTFVPVSVVPVGHVFAPQLGNLFYINASYSLRPLSVLEARFARTLQTRLDFYTFFRSTAAPVSAGGIDDTSESLYLGSEVDLALSFRPLSDVGVSLTAGLFFPSAAAFVPELAKVWFRGTLSASMSW